MARASRKVQTSKRKLPHVAGMIFGTPLMIEPRKLTAILKALGPRLEVEVLEAQDAAPAEPAERKPYSVTPDGVAVVDVMGTLVHRSMGMEALSGMSSYSQIGAELDAAVADPDVKAVLLLVDSHGGEVAGAFDLASKVRAASQKKPVTAFAEDMAASAAYLVASAAPTLLISQSGVAGSIGVVLAHTDTSMQDAADGVKVSYIHAGARKVDGMAPLDHEHRASGAALQAEVDRYYGMLVGAVAAYRDMTPDAVKGTQAGVYVGADAVVAGLADGVATLDQALSCALGQASADQEESAESLDERRAEHNAGARRGGRRAYAGSLPKMPFGPYEDFEDCVAKNQDKDDPEAYCGSIQNAVEGSHRSQHITIVGDLTREAAEVLAAQLDRSRGASRPEGTAPEGAEEELGMAEIKKDLSLAEQLSALRAENEGKDRELAQARADLASRDAVVKASDDRAKESVVKKHMDRGAVVPSMMDTVKDLAKFKSAEELDKALATFPVVLRGTAAGVSDGKSVAAEGTAAPLEKLKSIAKDKGISLAEACEQNPALYREHRVANPLGQRKV